MQINLTEIERATIRNALGFYAKMLEDAAPFFAESYQSQAVLERARKIREIKSQFQKGGRAYSTRLLNAVTAARTFLNAPVPEGRGATNWQATAVAHIQALCEDIDGQT